MCPTIGSTISIADRVQHMIVIKTEAIIHYPNIINTNKIKSNKQIEIAVKNILKAFIRKSTQTMSKLKRKNQAIVL